MKFRHIREERQRFVTLEPDFQELDQRYINNQNSIGSGLINRLLHWFDGNSSSSLDLKLPQALYNYKNCEFCGSLTLKNELKCDVCGSIKFLLIDKKNDA